ncbi:MAG: hypothetical protein J6S67_06130 [Methanobrevibacter sp.]|nr:hypothetical protein [Methanobrevibacter sp.]
MSKLKLEWDNCVLLARRICNDIMVELRYAYQDEQKNKSEIEYLKKQLYETEFCEIANVSPEYIIQRAYKQAKKGVKRGKYTKLS